MNRRTFLKSGAVVALGLSGAVRAAESGGDAAGALRTPRLSGEWVQLAPSPELPEIGSKPGQVVDHCLFRAADGNWQLWMQIRDTAVGRLFYRWEGTSELFQPDWKPHGICWRADRAAGESYNTDDQEWIHAPHVHFEDGKYILYYGGGMSEAGEPQICIALSDDGIRFIRLTDENGKSGVFSGPGYARDPMVLNVGGQYIMYYAANEGDEGIIAARTSSKPYGAPWSDYRVVSKGGICGTNRTSQQCPFVVPLDGYYYLFKMGPSNAYETAVYRSEDPFDFGSDDSKLVTVLEASAAEVLHDNGAWYISSLIPGYKGVRVSKLVWETPSK